MKQELVLLLGNVCSGGCVFAAAYLANKGVGGWGWFLFVALCVAVVPKSQDKEGKP